MANSNTNQEQDTTRSALSAIAAGILVIIAGFLVYNYFSKTSEEGETVLDKIEQKAEEITSGEQSEENEQVEEEEEAQQDQQKAQEDDEEEVSGGASTTTSTWTANNITPDTLSGSSYTVIRGDTLWEIAEGRYGSGFEWGKILEANKADIGFLPNGSQALIVPGQVLTLPQ